MAQAITPIIRSSIMNTKKILCTACLVICLVCSAFARQITFTTAVRAYSGDVMPLYVDVPQNVLDFFKEKGIDTSVTDASNMSIALRNSIKSVYADNKSTIDKMVQVAIKPMLAEGSVEIVYVLYGPIIWSMQYEQDTENS